MRPTDLAAEALNIASRLTVVRRRRGVSYGPHRRNKLDIYSPPLRPRDGAHFVFFYGGGWVKGSRAMYEFVGRSLASKGITTVIADYRLQQDASTSASIEDGAAAVRWAVDHFRAPIIIGGHSAGAYIAASLALTEEWSSAFDDGEIGGLVGMVGPYRYLPRIKNGSKPPVLLMTAGRDRIVDEQQALEFSLRIEGRGGHADVLRYPRATHATLVGALSPLLKGPGPVRRDLVHWVRHVSTG